MGRTQESIKNFLCQLQCSLLCSVQKVACSLVFFCTLLGCVLRFAKWRAQPSQRYCTFFVVCGVQFTYTLQHGATSKAVNYLTRGLLSVLARVWLPHNVVPSTRPNGDEKPLHGVELCYNITWSLDNNARNSFSQANSMF